MHTLMNAENSVRWVRASPTRTVFCVHFFCSAGIFVVSGKLCATTLPSAMCEWTPNHNSRVRRSETNETNGKKISAAKVIHAESGWHVEVCARARSLHRRDNVPIGLTADARFMQSLIFIFDFPIFFLSPTPKAHCDGRFGDTIHFGERLIKRQPTLANNRLFSFSWKSHRPQKPRQPEHLCRWANVCACCQRNARTEFKLCRCQSHATG